MDYKTAARLAQAIKGNPKQDYDSLYDVVFSFIASYIPPAEPGRL